MNDRTTVFLHVPKAAGASLRTLLKNVYGPDRVFWFRPGQRAKSMAILREMPEAQRAALKVVTGHIPFGLVKPVLARPVDYITVLRDPRAEPDHSGAGKPGSVDASCAPPTAGRHRNA